MPMGYDPWPARRESIFRAGPHSWELGNKTLLLGILNCTPDSFSDGGAFSDPDEIKRRLWEIAEEEADIVDIGGESTRPGADPIDTEEEWRRIAPALQAAGQEGYPLAVSVDTTKVEVAVRALEAGAVLINDISGLRREPRLAESAARAGAGLIVMHSKGEPRTMQRAPSYEDLIGEIRSFLKRSVAVAMEAGLAREQILVDPGIGFGKTLDHNLELLRQLSALDHLGAGIVVGTSRKSFIGTILDAPVGDRLEGSLATFVGAVLAGAHAVRVHDVGAARRAVRIADALRQR